MMFQRGSHYFPTRLRHTWEPQLHLPIDAKHHKQTYHVQLERATRALERFRNFKNTPAGDDEVSILLDMFFETAEAIWHCKDWVKREMDSDAKSDLDAHLDKPEQRILQCIANGSKHGQLRAPDKVFKGTITLDVDGVNLSNPGSLGDIYRRLRLDCEGEDPMHPTDFLERALNQWREFSLKHVWMKSLKKSQDAMASSR